MLLRISYCGPKLPSIYSKIFASKCSNLGNVIVYLWSQLLEIYIYILLTVYARRLHISCWGVKCSHMLSFDMHYAFVCTSTSWVQNPSRVHNWGSSKDWHAHQVVWKLKNIILRNWDSFRLSRHSTTLAHNVPMSMHKRWINSNIYTRKRLIHNYTINLKTR